MRVRDLRWYILTSLIILISYAAIAFCYYLSVRNGKVESSMRDIALEVSKSRSVEISNRIDDLYDIYLEDTNNNMIYSGTNTENKLFEICTNQSSLHQNFNYADQNKKVLLAQDLNFNIPANNTADQKNNNFYFYFEKPTTDTTLSNTGYLVCRVLASTVFSRSETSYDEFLFEDISYYVVNSTVGYLNAPAEKNILPQNFEDFIEKKEVNISNSSATTLGVYSRSVTVNTNNISNNVIASALEIDSFKFYTLSGNQTVTGHVYVTELIPTTDPILGLDWIVTQAIVFYIATVIVIGAILAVFILGVRRASQLLRADRHSTKATKAIVIRIDNTGKIIFTNQTFKKMFGNAKLLSVDSFTDVLTNEPILKTIKENKAFECSLLDSNDNERFLHLSPLYISRSYYLMGTEITQDYNRRKHLELMSGKNEYTNCDNGFIFTNQFETILDNNSGYDVAFVEYNVHKYEEIIGVFGQTSFAELLTIILQMLKESYSDKLIFHMTDSKFLIVCPNKDINEVVTKINETLEKFRRPITVKQNNIYLTMKVVVFNYKSADYDASLTDQTKRITSEYIKTKLDLAYRNMKNLSGRDYIIYDPAMDTIILATDEMEKDIETGLINHEFQMFLQPQFDVVSNKIAGFEALIRWLNPKYANKSPQIFIELAEQRGHMLDIGRFVITESFKLAKKLEPHGTHISVNISPVQLLQVGFVQQLIDEFNKLDLKPGSVAIEITETLLMGNFQLVTEKLKLLKDKGFSIHLDDFGTGYSSMLYLKDLPIDTIKIDKEFTKFIETDKVSEAIVRTIVNLGNSLNLGIICEGVETQIQSDMIKKFGCRIIQGYLIGKAIPYEEAVQLIEKYENK